MNAHAFDNDLPRMLEDLGDRAGELAVELLGPPNRAMSRRNEDRYGRNGSLVVHTGGSRKGRWKDFETGEGGDLLSLIRREKGLSFSGAIDWARDFLGWSSRET